MTSRVFFKQLALSLLAAPLLIKEVIGSEILKSTATSWNGEMRIMETIMIEYPNGMICPEDLNLTLGAMEKADLTGLKLICYKRGSDGVYRKES